MLLMLLVVTVYLTITQPGRLSDIRGELMSALSYTSNWYLIFRQVSYFESFGPLSPIGHLWSLAVEEQFYLLWPLFLWGMICLIPFPTRGKLAVATLAVAVVSFTAMAIMYEPGSDPSRVYYGTDTRAFGLLIGAGFAIVIPSRKLAVPLRKGSVTLDAFGAVGFCILLMMIASTDKYDDSLYRGGLLVLSVTSGLVIIAAASPFSRMGKLLSWKPLRWIGVRSYGIYLWHYPVHVLMSTKNSYEEQGFLYQVIQLTIIFILSALSYRYLEKPIRNGKLFKFKEKEKKGMKSKMKKGIRTITLSAIFMIVLICAACEGAANKQPADSTEPTTEAAANDPGSTSDLTPSLTPGETPDTTPSIAPEKQGAVGVTAIGDSVMVGVKADLEKLIPGIVVDGKVSRQLSDAIDVVNALKSENKLGHAVVIELGTNGPFTSNKLDALLAAIGDDKQVYLVNTRVPREWQDTVNKTLAKAADEHSNVKLIDWHAFSEGKSDWFTKDGVHLQTNGAESYAELIADTIG
ncbi:peptidoglycan/LPS O-acetylase OafA/YrhL/lysophospholipase L1-like esterase [Paenibacillus sacheonensis]|nr:peptidoglycan/LPS O-acetylase OafA/YrhL/lysophospholipase L1-like esterase [Paenibacillus sacheonensis]